MLASFWLADNLTLLGRHEEAKDMFERLCALCNDVGLLSEEYDPKADRLLGNFPQAFSHVALVKNTAANLSMAEHGPSVMRIAVTACPAVGALQQADQPRRATTVASSASRRVELEQGRSWDPTKIPRIRLSVSGRSLLARTGDLWFLVRPLISRTAPNTEKPHRHPEWVSSPEGRRSKSSPAKKASRPEGCEGARGPAVGAILGTTDRRQV